MLLFHTATSRPISGRTLRNCLIAALLLSLPFPAGAKDIDWCAFRLQQFTVVQSYGFSFSGELSWNPLFALGHGFGIRGNIGATLLKGFPDRFAAAEYEARLSYAFNRSLAVEAGGGAQTWFLESGGTSPMLSAAVSWIFFRKIQWLRAGITGGYSVFLPKDNLTQEVRLGATFAFGNHGGKQ
jgi:hypothetical protein